MDLHVSIKAETLFEFDIPVLGTFHFTNSFLTMLIVMAALIVGGWLLARRATLVPTHTQSIFEMLVEFMLGIVQAAAGERIGRRIFPLVGGLFIFILFANYAGLLPGVGTIGHYETEKHEAEADVASIAFVQADFEADHGEEVLVPWFRSPSADLNMTLAMSIIVVFIVQVVGIMAHGFGGRIKHMADPWWIFPIELVGEVARIVSLAFRLFGNIFAGEVLIAVMIAFGVVAFGVLAPLTTVFLFFEVLIGFIQALVFAILTVIYIALAAAGHGDGEEAHAH
jgi:F-type H+-transporting ATPase subunit a